MAAASLRTLARRFDALAVDQLRAEVARLATENDQLRDELASAEQRADTWARDATDMHLQLCEAHLGVPGITQAGQLVVVQPEARA